MIHNEGCRPVQHITYKGRQHTILNYSNELGYSANGFSMFNWNRLYKSGAPVRRLIDVQELDPIGKYVVLPDGTIETKIARGSCLVQVLNLDQRGRWLYLETPLGWFKVGTTGLVREKKARYREEIDDFKKLRDYSFIAAFLLTGRIASSYCGAYGISVASFERDADIKVNAIKKLIEIFMNDPYLFEIRKKLMDKTPTQKLFEDAGMGDKACAKILHQIMVDSEDDALRAKIATGALAIHGHSVMFGDVKKQVEDQYNDRKHLPPPPQG